MQQYFNNVKQHWKTVTVHQFSASRRRQRYVIQVSKKISHNHIWSVISGIMVDQADSWLTASSLTTGCSETSVDDCHRFQQLVRERAVKNIPSPFLYLIYRQKTTGYTWWASFFQCEKLNGLSEAADTSNWHQRTTLPHLAPKKLQLNTPERLQSAASKNVRFAPEWCTICCYKYIRFNNIATSNWKKISRNFAKLMKSWILQQQAQEAFPFFFCVSFRALIKLPEQPIRVMSLTDELSLILHAE